MATGLSAQENVKHGGDAMSAFIYIRPWCQASLVLIVPLYLGCSKAAPKADPARLVQVEGAVTSGGLPAPNVAVVFVPSDKNKPAARALTDARGHYVLQYKGRAPGVEPGEYKVMFVFVGPRPAGFAGGGGQPDFADAEKTPFRASVGAAGGIHNFDLKRPPSGSP